MTNKKESSQSPKTLRQRAEEMSRTSRSDIANMGTEEVQRLVQELQIHQMELQLQNEELREAQVELAESLDRYSDLYEFAPVGYVTLDRLGKILDANLTVTRMLGVERQALIQSQLSNFIVHQSQDAFHFHRQALQSNETKQTCELEMRRADGTFLTVRLESVAFGAEPDRGCRTALIDLTVERRMWRQLMESEQRYRRLTDAVTDYVYRVQIEQGRAANTFHGANCELVTGYTPDEFAASEMLWIAMVPEEDRAAVERHAAKILSGKIQPAIEHRIRRKDGGLRWVLNTVSPQYDSHGNLVAYDGLLHDITDRKQSEESLRELTHELEQRVVAQTSKIRLLAEAVSHLAEGIVITDDELDWPGPCIRFVNEAMCRITGYREDELVGQTPRVLQGEQVNRTEMQLLKSELAAGRPFLCETVNYRKDGTTYDAELFITPLFDDAGHRTNFVSIHRDITARKQAERALRQSEERIRAILRTAADAIITIDRRGLIIEANLATERMFGFTQSELHGANVKILMPAPFHDEHDGYIARYEKTGEARIIGKGREVVGRRKDGTLFPIWLAVSETDQHNLFTGIIRDLSQIKELERHLLEIASDEQRRIGQELHDGTGQELTGLSLFAGTLLETLGTASQREVEGIRTWLIEDAHFQRLQKSAARLSQGLVLANRHVHELSHGIMPVQIDAEGLRSALMELAAMTDGHDNITCRFDCPVPVTVPNNITATHLYRIAQEALNNSLRHGHADQIIISLARDGDHIILEVSDNGIGFDPSTRHLDSNIGKGMGLSIMEYRASVIGGVLRIERKPERGMRLTCTISRGSS
ncbi:MAG: PAS domain S-box protein [Pirellula sp.]